MFRFFKNKTIYMHYFSPFKLRIYQKRGVWYLEEDGSFDLNRDRVPQDEFKEGQRYRRVANE